MYIYSVLRITVFGSIAECPASYARNYAATNVGFYINILFCFPILREFETE